jgi:glyoxylase-like metal-dependent hydrolase (beta-lactamase superfamily II)/rhodanese-related sulfurtransferase
MKIEQIYTKCLSEAAYYVESAGECLIIDPLREIKPYIQRAEQRNCKIKYILETHFHADFVSGHVDLSKKTGAEIVYGPKAKAEFKFKELKDGEYLFLGNIKIKAIHTPGHTLESTCYLLINEKGEQKALFSGDTLFIGDVGRPDLAVKTELSREDLAGLLFDSLRKKILPLNDNIIVYPAHGSGSACGKSMSKETFDKLGNQKKTNYALRADMTKDEFIKELLEGILPSPQYFPKNAKMNSLKENKEIDVIISTGTKALTLEEFDKEVKGGALILDVRSEKDFSEGHIPNSWFIGIDGAFAPWVGSLIEDLKKKIIIVCPEKREEEVVKRLARVGYDNTRGYLFGSFEAWEKSGRQKATISSEQAKDLEELYGGVEIVDVRKPREFNSEHIKGALSLPLDYLFRNTEENIDKDKTYHIHCAGGYRSVIFISILKSKGYEKLINVKGGYNALKETTSPKKGSFCTTNQV